MIFQNCSLYILSDQFKPLYTINIRPVSFNPLIKFMAGQIQNNL